VRAAFRREPFAALSAAGTGTALPRRTELHERNVTGKIGSGFS
jgi:hypothetical protein